MDSEPYATVEDNFEVVQGRQTTGQTLSYY